MLDPSAEDQQPLKEPSAQHQPELRLELRDPEQLTMEPENPSALIPMLFRCSEEFFSPMGPILNFRSRP